MAIPYDEDDYETKEVTGHCCDTCEEPLVPGKVVWGCNFGRHTYDCQTWYCEDCGDRDGDWRCDVCNECAGDDESETGDYCTSCECPLQLSHIVYGCADSRATKTDCRTMLCKICANVDGSCCTECSDAKG